MSIEQFTSHDNIPQQEAENKNRSYSRAADMLVEEARASVARRYGVGEEKREYHGPEHTGGVVGRSEIMLQALEAAGVHLSPKHKALAKIAASFHDIFQFYGVDDAGGKEVMQRRAPKNETYSAEAACRAMRALDEESGGALFTEEDYTLVTDAIMATVPKWNPELKTTYQPNLKPDSPLIVRILAIADLGTSGFNSKEFLKEGDALFREEQLDLADAFESLARIQRSQAQGVRLSEEDEAALTDFAQKKESYRERMLAWSASQPTFAEGRKLLFNQEIDNATLGPEAKDVLKSLFSDEEFNRSIALSRAVASRRGQMQTCEDVARDMGYALPRFDTGKVLN